MVTLQKSGDSAVKFVFTDSDHYLYGNGELEVPVNSLMLVIDESEMVTFKKLSGDPFISFRADNSNLGTKAAIEEFYKANMVGSTGGGSESGITEEEVQDMIDDSLEDYYDKDEIDAGFASVDASLSGKADASDVTEEISAAVSGKADTTAVTAVNNALTAHTTDTGIHVNQQEKDAWNAKLDASAYTPVDLSEYWTSAQTEASIEAATSGKADTSAVTAVENDVVALQDALAGKANTAALTAHTSDTDIHVSQQEKSAWNAKAEPYSAGTGIEISGNVISVTGGTGSGVLVINLDDLTNNMTDDKWDELANALENDIPIFSVIDASGEGTTDIQQFPVNGMLMIDENEGTSEITLYQLFGGGYYEIHIQKNGSEDYTITNDWHFVPNELSAGTGIDITDNVISVTGGSSVTVDPTLDSGSTNPVANSAITTAIDTKAELSNTVTDVRVYDTLYGRELQKKVGNGGYSTILYYGKINNTNIINEDYITNFQLVEKSSITSAITSASTNAEVAGAKAVYDAIQAAGGGGGGSVTVDSYLNNQSTNPVENQAIAQAIDDTNAVVDTKADQSELYELLGGSNDEMNPVTPIRFQRISQSDYDDLLDMGTTDPDTVYIITPDEPDEENEGDR